jgi:hypothetical protein
MTVYFVLAYLYPWLVLTKSQQLPHTCFLVLKQFPCQIFGSITPFFPFYIMPLMSVTVTLHARAQQTQMKKRTKERKTERTKNKQASTNKPDSYLGT